jgi:hypothetical protein
MNQPEEIDESEINPRTGLPYKQSAKLRAQKLKWSKNNRETVNKCTRAYHERNKEQLYEYQRAYHQRLKEERLYFYELFGEALAMID